MEAASGTAASDASGLLRRRPRGFFGSCAPSSVDFLRGRPRPRFPVVVVAAFPINMAGSPTTACVGAPVPAAATFLAAAASNTVLENQRRASNKANGESEDACRTAHASSTRRRNSVCWLVDADFPLTPTSKRRLRSPVAAAPTRTRCSVVRRAMVPATKPIILLTSPTFAGEKRKGKEGKKMFEFATEHSPFASFSPLPSFHLL